MTSPRFGVQDWSRIGVAPFPLFSNPSFPLVAGQNFILGDASLHAVPVPASTSTQVEFLANVDCQVELLFVDASPPTITNLATGGSFDVAANFSIAGWILPNTDGFLIAVVNAAGSGTASMRILTGLPTFKRNASGSMNLALLAGSFTIGPSSSEVFSIDAFAGDAVIYAQSPAHNSGIGQNLDIAIDARNYNNTLNAEIAHVFDSVISAYGFAVITPTLITLPAMICTAVVTNHTSSLVTGSIGLIQSSRGTTL